MLRALIFTLTVFWFGVVEGRAQVKPESPASEPSTVAILPVAQQHLRKGEECFSTGDLECARREFDRAIDVFIEAGVDVRSDKQLHLAWREMIEKINRYQTGEVAGLKAGAWRTQEYEGRPAEEPQEAVAANRQQLADGPLSPEEFQRRFSELRKSFREKYSRDMVLTGADHGEHRRLYGRGSAFDIRVRDLDREQVKFIIATGNELGLRIKDFSTWERVAAHNARTYALGRPLDTLATGIHLHIDRMVATRKQTMAARPVIKKKQRQATASQ